MPINAKDVDWVEEPPMNFWEATFLPAVVDGLRATGHHVTHFQPVTQMYPEVASDLPKHYRGVHRLSRDDAGRVKCVACMMCATACPARCITIQGAQAPWEDRDKYPESFVIDELRCIYCGMCEEACPVDAIEMTHLYDMTGVSREEMIFDREKLLGVTEVYRVGGAQAVASLAYGVEGIPRVDKIVGPGNLFVALAKRYVFGEVDIDSIAGPSEVIVLADESAHPAFVAADLISQAEHSPGSGVLITWHAPLIEQVKSHLESQLAQLERGDLARESLEQYGAFILARDENEAARLTDELATEHLHISTADPEKMLDKAAKQPGKLGQRARLAKTLRGFNK